MYLVQQGRGGCLTNRPFAGALGVKVYAGLGGVENIRYRVNRVFAPGAVPVNFDATNDVSVGSAASPTAVVTFTSPVTWHSRDDIWLQLRTYAADIENESLTGARRLSLNSSGTSVTVFTGSGRVLGVDAVAGGGASIRFTWSTARDSVNPLLFAAVRTAGPTSPATVTQASTASRLQRIALSGLSVGTYTFRIEARNGSLTPVVIGTATVVVVAAPTTTASATLVEIS